MSSSNDSNSSNLVKVKKTKVKENWDDESEEESEVEMECNDIIASEEIIKDKDIEPYEKNEPEYDDYGCEDSYGGDFEDASESLEYEDYEYGVEGAEPLEDDYDYEEIDKKLGNHFRLH